MHRILKFPLVAFFILVLLLVSSPSRGVVRTPAKSPRAAALLREVADRLDSTANKYEKRGQSNDAIKWRLWAAYYRQVARLGPSVTVDEFLPAYIALLKTQKQQAERAGLSKLAEQYGELRAMWIDIYE